MYIYTHGNSQLILLAFQPLMCVDEKARELAAFFFSTKSVLIIAGRTLKSALSSGFPLF